LSLCSVNHVESCKLFLLFAVLEKATVVLYAVSSDGSCYVYATDNDVQLPLLWFTHWEKQWYARFIFIEVWFYSFMFVVC